MKMKCQSRIDYRLLASLLPSGGVSQTRGSLKAWPDTLDALPRQTDEERNKYVKKVTRYKKNPKYWGRKTSLCPCCSILRPQFQRHIMCDYYK